jgi:NTP pyrophosphatase (non-canonical NTP hydrolase)
MEIKDASKTVDKIIQNYGGYWEPLSMLARLTEEVGELSRAMNIEYGGKRSKNSSDGRQIGEELSDVLFTILAIANSEGINLEQMFKDKLEKDSKKIEIYKGDKN